MRRRNALSSHFRYINGTTPAGASPYERVLAAEVLEERSMLAPILINGTFNADEGTPAVIPALAFARAQQGIAINPGSIQFVSLPSNGIITGVNNANGDVMYDPLPGFTGTDAFSYFVLDVQGNASNVGTLTIHVYPPAPVANDFTATTTENTAVALNTLAHITVPTGTTLNPLTLQILTLPTHGTATINYNNDNIIYTPNSGFAGKDTLVYQIEDNDSRLSNPGTITINVTGKPPVANNDSAITVENSPVAINVLANDTDPNPASVGHIDPATLVVGEPAHGTVSVNLTNGVVTYTPNANFFGNDSFTYTVEDSTGAVSNVATVSISVFTHPVAGALAATTNEEVPILLNVLGVVTDQFGTINPASLVIVAPPGHGTATVEASNNEILYTPGFNFFGTDTFQYTVADVHGITSAPGTVTITVNFVSKPPVAVDDVASTSAGVAVVIPVLANDYELDPPSKSTIDVTSVALLTQPTSGSASLNAATGVVTYTPNPGFQGEDGFTYTVNNTLGKTSNVASVIIRVGAPVTLSGEVWADTNNNDVIDPTEIGIGGVTVTVTETSGPISYSVSTITAANGTYSFSEGNVADKPVGALAATGSYVLPAGTYTITETQPGYFVGGKSQPGTPAPTSYSNTAFDGVSLTPTEAATGFNFAQQGLTASFIATYLSRRAFFASADPTVVGLNLSQGAVWFSFDGGTTDLIAAKALGAAGQGSVTLTLLNAGMQTLATTTGASGTASLQVPGSPGNIYYLEVTGTNTSTDMDVAALAAPPMQYYNAANPLDVNGDGQVTPIDALSIIDALNKQGSGPLPLVAQQTDAPPDYLDVLNSGMLSPLDALTVIDYLNSNAAAAASAQAAAATSASPTVAVSATTDSAAPGLAAASGSGAPAVDAQAAAGLATDQAISQLTSTTPPAAMVIAPASASAAGDPPSTSAASQPPATVTSNEQSSSRKSAATSGAQPVAVDEAVSDLLANDDGNGQGMFFA